MLWGKCFLIRTSRLRSVESKLTIKITDLGKALVERATVKVLRLLLIIIMSKKSPKNADWQMLIYNIVYICSAVGIAGNEQLETIYLVFYLKEWCGTQTFVVGPQKWARALFVGHLWLPCDTSHYTDRSGSGYQNHLTCFGCSALLGKWRDWLLMLWTHGKS